MYINVSGLCDILMYVNANIFNDDIKSIPVQRINYKFA